MNWKNNNIQFSYNVTPGQFKQFLISCWDSNRKKRANQNSFKLDAYRDYDYDDFCEQIENDLDEFQKQCDSQQENW